MAWSTRQLAELANTTVKAVRHYHEVGLLDMPERASNGYKQYGVSHLVRLVQIKRLSDLGIPLAQIAEMDRGEGSDDAIRVLDAELEETIARLTRIRAELAVILSHRAPPEVPAGFAQISRDFSETQRSLVAVYSTILSEEDMAEFFHLLAEPDATDDEFENLPADADDATIDRLAERIVPVVRRGRQNHPRLADPTARSPLGATRAGSTMAHAVVELYNPAQLRVLQRMNELLTRESDDAGSELADS